LTTAKKVSPLLSTLEKTLRHWEKTLKIVPARDPKHYGGRKRRMYYNVDDDVNVDDYYDEMVMMMMMMMMMWCESAQSKYTRTFHKSHFVYKFTGTVPYANPATPVLCEPVQSNAILYGNLQGKWPRTPPWPAFCAEDTCAASVLCEPARSKCTWTFHKSNFIWKFTGKMPRATDTTWIEHRALTVTVSQCATLFGEIS